MITFLIPTYKEFSNIELIVNKINNLYLKQNYKIFFIDDDSKDGSLEKFKMLKKNHKNIDYYIRKSSARDLTKSIICALEFKIWFNRIKIKTIIKDKRVKSNNFINR